MTAATVIDDNGSVDTTLNRSPHQILSIVGRVVLGISKSEMIKTIRRHTMWHNFHHHLAVAGDTITTTTTGDNVDDSGSGPTARYFFNIVDIAGFCGDQAGHLSTNERDFSVANVQVMTRLQNLNQYRAEAKTKYGRVVKPCGRRR